MDRRAMDAHRVWALLLHGVQVNQLLELGDKTKGTKKYLAVSKWNSQLQSLHQTVVNKVC
eukprot:1193144-Prorocentrum_minimum.AAC.3